mgnify:CR=1 FL=1
MVDREIGLVSAVYTVFEVWNRDLIPEYLMLWFKRPEFDRYARYHSHGSVREIFDWEEMCNVELPIPPIEEQQKIVDAYQTIEHRIALKKKINENLEKSLLAVFKDTFTEKSSSDLIKLSKIINFGNGKARPIECGNVPVYGGNGILSYTNNFNNENVVVIGRVGAYCGSIYLEQETCWVSDNAIFAKSKISTEEYCDYFLFKYLNLFNYHIGTGQQLLTQEILNNIEIFNPNAATVNWFNKKAKLVFSKINLNIKEIRILKELGTKILTKLLIC